MSVISGECKKKRNSVPSLNSLGRKHRTHLQWKCWTSSWAFYFCKSWLIVRRLYEETLLVAERKHSFSTNTVISRGKQESNQLYTCWTGKPGVFNIWYRLIPRLIPPLYSTVGSFCWQYNTVNFYRDQTCRGGNVRSPFVFVPAIRKIDVRGYSSRPRGYECASTTPRVLDTYQRSFR